MIFRQLFDPESSTYSYLLASRRGGEALIFDPVLEKVDRYLQLVKELDLRLVKATTMHDARIALDIARLLPARRGIDQDDVAHRPGVAAASAPGRSSASAGGAASP